MSAAVTVKDLKIMLEAYPDDLIVCTAGDDEGNSFRELYADCLVGGRYDANEREFTAYGDEDDEGHQDDMPPEDWNAVCIW